MRAKPKARSCQICITKQTRGMQFGCTVWLRHKLSTLSACVCLCQRRGKNMIQAEKRWCNQRLGFNLTCNPLFMRLDAIEGACQCCVVQWGAFASWWPACHGWDVAALVVAVSQWVFRKCSPVTARTACTWAEGTIFVCEAVTWSADPTSGCINNKVFTGTVSVYILWWRSCSAGRKTKCLLSAPSLEPFSCLSATFSWHV